MTTRISSPVLDQEIARLVRQGFQLLVQRRASASLVRPKQFSFLAFFLLLLLGLWPSFIYIGWYLAKRDETVYLHMEDGRVVAVRGGGVGFFSYVLLGLLLSFFIVVTLLFVAVWWAALETVVNTNS